MTQTGAESVPVVSVVIPTYNGSSLLLETLETVFAQTWGDYELIVVDDGSSDDTPERVEEAFRRRRAEAGVPRQRLRLLRQANAGIGATRNRGIAEARGEYVALLDHDDLWRPGKLAAQVAYMRANPECIGCSVRYSFSTDPNVPVYRFDDVVDERGLVRRPLGRLADGCVFLISSSIVFDRKKALGLRYATERNCIEDVPFQVGLLSRGAFGIAGSGVEMVYRRHPTSGSMARGYFSSGIRLLRRMDRAGEWGDLGVDDRDDLKRFLASLGRVAVRSELTDGRRVEALRVYFGEFLEQWRQRRARFLLLFWAMLLLPNRWVRRYWNA